MTTTQFSQKDWATARGIGVFPVLPLPVAMRFLGHSIRLSHHHSVRGYGDEVEALILISHRTNPNKQIQTDQTVTRMEFDQTV